MNNKTWKYELKNNNGATLECCKEQRNAGAGANAGASASASILFSSSAVTYLQNNYVTRTARETMQVLRLVMTLLKRQSAVTPFKVQKQQVRGGKVFRKSV